MKILLLNQYGPDSGAPTGRILGELASHLEQNGWETRLISTGLPYGKPRRGLRRIMHELWSHASLFFQSLLHRRVSAVISLTSPACLAITAGIIARLHRAHHYHWVMDLYPDVGIKIGEISDGPVTRTLSRLMQRAYRQSRQVIALDEDMQSHLAVHYAVDSTIIPPLPPHTPWPSAPPHPSGQTRQWLYSGNLGRAHEVEVLLNVQKELESRHVPAELILQGQGPQFLSSQDAAHALGLHRVRWRKPVPADQLAATLLASDVLIVTRRDELKGLLLPSKLQLAELSGRPVLWIGDTDGHTARRLAATGRHGVFSADQVVEIAQWLQALFSPEASAQSVSPSPTDPVRRQFLAHWEALLRQDLAP